MLFIPGLSSAPHRHPTIVTHRHLLRPTRWHHCLHQLQRSRVLQHPRPQLQPQLPLQRQPQLRRVLEPVTLIWQYQLPPRPCTSVSTGISSSWAKELALPATPTPYFTTLRTCTETFSSRELSGGTYTASDHTACKADTVAAVTCGGSQKAGVSKPRSTRWVSKKQTCRRHVQAAWRCCWHLRQHLLQPQLGRVVQSADLW